MKTNVLIAKSIRHANDTATVDWGWQRYKRGGRLGFLDDNGEFVIATSRCESLRSLRPGAKVYLGYGWEGARDSSMISYICRRRMLEIATMNKKETVANMNLRDTPISTDISLTVPFEDWSRVRSPGRARRRQKRGFKQNISYTRAPDPSAYEFNGRIVMHPTVLLRLQREYQDNENKMWRSAA